MNAGNAGNAGNMFSANSHGFIIKLHLPFVDSQYANSISKVKCIYKVLRFRWINKDDRRYNDCVGLLMEM